MNWHDIPGWFDFEDIYDEAVERASDGALFAEVGCWLGRSTAYLARRIIESRKEITLWCIDHWRGDSVESHHFRQARENGGSVTQLFVDNMKACGVLDVIRLAEGDSADTAFSFCDHAFDFIFIDAAHDYFSVYRDICAWLPKLKPTGNIAGHDYLHPDVSRAVGELIPNHHYREPASWERND